MKARRWIARTAKLMKNAVPRLTIMLVEVMREHSSGMILDKTDFKRYLD